MFSVLVLNDTTGLGDGEFFGANYNGSTITVIHEPTSWHADGNGNVEISPRGAHEWHPNVDEINVSLETLFSNHMTDIRCDRSKLTLNYSYENVSYPFPLFGGADTNSNGYAITYKFPYAKSFSSYTTLINATMSYEMVETLIKSLYCWNDGNSHEICLSVDSNVVETEEFQKLIEKANNKGWTVYY